MAFIPPKNLAHLVAITIAAGCNDGVAPTGPEQAKIIGTADALLAKMEEEAAAAEKAFKLTDAGQRKALIAKLAGRARAATLARLDRLADGTIKTEQARKGSRYRNGDTVESLARELRQALIADGKRPEDFRPVDGKPTKSAPAAVVTLAMAESTAAVAAKMAKPVVQVAARAA